MNHAIPFVFGFMASLSLSYFYVFSRYSRTIQSGESVHNQELYDETLADKLYKEVRILCWITTTPENHLTKAIHVKKTWGKRCNKLLFMSSEKDPAIDAIALPVKEGRHTLWDKTKQAFQYIHRHHIDDADWFLKADDDSYVIPENVRLMLWQYHSETPLYFGHRFAVENLEEGYMAGGGYILSKEAVKRLVTEAMVNDTMCRNQEDGAEDYEIGRCLTHLALFVDDRDSLNQKRIFPVGIEEHLVPVVDTTFWYQKSLYYPVKAGSLDCCSDTPIAIHYTAPQTMYFYEYVINHVHPFGIERNLTEKLPAKFTFDEILKRSDVESESPNYRKHAFIHDLKDSYKFRKK